MHNGGHCKQGRRLGSLGRGADGTGPLQGLNARIQVISDRIKLFMSGHEKLRSSEWLEQHHLVIPALASSAAAVHNLHCGVSGRLWS